MVQTCGGWLMAHWKRFLLLRRVATGRGVGGAAVCLTIERIDARTLALAREAANVLEQAITSDRSLLYVHWTGHTIEVPSAVARFVSEYALWARPPGVRR